MKYKILLKNKLMTPLVPADFFFFFSFESCSVVSNYAIPWTVVHGILQARMLEWVAVPFSRGSSQPRNRTQVSCIVGRFFTS